MYPSVRKQTEIKREGPRSPEDTAQEDPGTGLALSNGCTRHTHRVSKCNHRERQERQHCSTKTRRKLCQCHFSSPPRTSPILHRIFVYATKLTRRPFTTMTFLTGVAGNLSDTTARAAASCSSSLASDASTAVPRIFPFT